MAGEGEVGVVGGAGVEAGLIGEEGVEARRSSGGEGEERDEEN